MGNYGPRICGPLFVSLMPSISAARSMLTRCFNSPKSIAWDIVSSSLCLSELYETNRHCLLIIHTSPMLNSGSSRAGTQSSESPPSTTLAILPKYSYSPTRSDAYITSESQMPDAAPQPAKPKRTVSERALVKKEWVWEPPDGTDPPPVTGPPAPQMPAFLSLLGVLGPRRPQ